MSDPHSILSVKPGAGKDVIKARYKVVCKIVHPDRHGQDPSAVHFFQMVQKAYDALMHDFKAGSRTPSSAAVKKKLDAPRTDAEGTIRVSDIMTLADKLQDPWFHPNFELTDFFGDVSIPEKKEDKSCMRPRSSRN